MAVHLGAEPLGADRTIACHRLLRPEMPHASVRPTGDGEAQRLAGMGKSNRSVLVERHRQYERAVGLADHQPMPGSAMGRAFFVYEDQRVGIEGAVIVAFTADVNQGGTVFAL